MYLFSSPTQRLTTLLPFLKQKVSPILDPPIFSFSCQLPLSFSLSYLLRENTSVGEVTQTPVHSPAHFPAGMLPGSLCFLVGRHSVTGLLQSLLTGIHPVIMLLLSPVSHSFSLSIS